MSADASSWRSIWRSAMTRAAIAAFATRGAKGDATSVYFRDPDGSLLEFMVYPAA